MKPHFRSTLFTALTVFAIAGVAVLVGETKTSRAPSSLDGGDAVAPVCERTGEALKAITLRKDMRMYGSNAGGLINGGVCWWHSRMQRAAWGLAEFLPTEPRATSAQAKRILDDLAHMKAVRIPGYANFFDFTRDHWRLVQKELNQWQLRDAFLNQAWTRGMSRKAKYRASKAEHVIGELFETYRANAQRDRVTWVKLQMPGVVAHSALIIDMSRSETGDYLLTAVDSNAPEWTAKWTYRPGTKFVDNNWYGKMMPFAGYERDLVQIEAARNAYCHGQTVAAE